VVFLLITFFLVDTGGVQMAVRGGYGSRSRIQLFLPDLAVPLKGFFYDYLYPKSGKRTSPGEFLFFVFLRTLIVYVRSPDWGLLRPSQGQGYISSLSFCLVG